ncbi:MAG: hypothetical protein M3R17_16680 [Bacteroidota bacterium]|nr:hypothetical protein [Bacteroidota bacterium]
MKCVIGILIAAFLISFQSQEQSTKNAFGKNTWVGSYVNEYGTVLNVKEQTPTEITFEIVSKKGECQESFRGKATFTSATNATYKDNSNFNDNENILIITLMKRTDGKIEVSETGFEHAPDCLSFSGIFKPSY